MFFAQAWVKAYLTTYVSPIKQTTIYKQFGLTLLLGVQIVVPSRVVTCLSGIFECKILGYIYSIESLKQDSPPNFIVFKDMEMENIDKTLRKRFR